MHDLTERNRRPTPFEKPFGLAFHAGLLWTGSRETGIVYGIDPGSWAIRASFEAPAKTFDIAPHDGALRVIVGFGGEDDDRYWYRLDPKTGFDPGSKTPLPDLTGAFMATAGSTTYLSQAHFGRILEIGPHDVVRREIALPARCAGMAVVDSTFYMIEADSEFENLRFGTLDVTKDAPAFAPLAKIDENARTLAHDGTQWWTCYRDDNSIGTFTL